MVSVWQAMCPGVRACTCLQALEGLLRGLDAVGLKAMSLSAVHEAAVKEGPLQKDKASCSLSLQLSAHLFWIDSS